MGSVAVAEADRAAAELVRCSQPYCAAGAGGAPRCGDSRRGSRQRSRRSAGGPARAKSAFRVAPAHAAARSAPVADDHRAFERLELRTLVGHRFEAVVLVRCSGFVGTGGVLHDFRSVHRDRAKGIAEAQHRLNGVRLPMDDTRRSKFRFGRSSAGAQRHGHPSIGRPARHGHLLAVEPCPRRGGCLRGLWENRGLETKELQRRPVLALRRSRFLDVAFITRRPAACRFLADAGP